MTESTRKKQHLHEFHITGFLGHCRIVWLLDTGSVRNILSFQTCSRLPKTLQFPLHEKGTQVFLADGQSTKTYGMGNTTVRIGTQEINVRVLVADIEDEAILGIEFFSDVDAKIDVVQQNIVVNGEEIDCYDHDQQLTFRCIGRRLVTVAPNSEAVIPVHLNHRQCLSRSKGGHQWLRIIEPCVNTRLQEKVLFVGRTLVCAGEAGPVPVRIMNTSGEIQSICAQTVIGVAKPVANVTEIEIPGTDRESTPKETQEEEGMLGDLLPDPVRELWQQSSVELTQEESQKVAELLCKHQAVFALSDLDLSRTNHTTHQIDTGTAKPISALVVRHHGNR